MRKEELLTILADSEGYESIESMLTDAIHDSVVPAICTKCENTGQMEPDQDAGYCEECGNNTMKSCLVLAGLI